MSYSISFRAKLDGVDQWVNVGDYIKHSSNIGRIIRPVLGFGLVELDGKNTMSICPVITSCIKQLASNKQYYRQFETGYESSDVEHTIEFLRQILDNCLDYPTAIIEISN